MLALASSDVSGRGLAPSVGAGEQSALPRPSSLPNVEYRSSKYSEGASWYTTDILVASAMTYRFRDPYEMRYVYWTGYEVMYGQWGWCGIEYPWPRRV